MVFTDNSNILQPSSATDTSSQVLTAELARITDATAYAAELHLLQVEHAKELLLQAKEGTIHAREKHALEMEQMKELHLMKIKKIEVDIKRTFQKN